MWGFGKKLKNEQQENAAPNEFSMFRRTDLEALIDSHPSLARKVLLTLFETSPQSRHVNLAISVVSAEMGVSFCREMLERFVMERPGLAQDAAKQLIRFRTDDVEPIIHACVMAERAQMELFCN